MEQVPRFLSVTDVANVLNITIRQVRSLLHSGDLRGIQVGGRGIWRIEVNELEDYIARQYQKSPSTTADEQQQRDSTPS